MDQYDMLDQALMTKITETRDEYGACTMRHVANRLGYSPDVVRHRLQKLMKDGLVAWNEMPGSLRVLDQPVAAATDESSTSQDEPQATDDSEQPTADEPAPQEESEAPAKARPARKTQAK